MQNHKIQLLDDKIDHRYELLDRKIDHRDGLLDDKIDHRFQLLNDKIDHRYELLDRSDQRLDDKIDFRYQLLDRSDQRLDDKIDHESELLDGKIDHRYELLDGKIDHRYELLNDMIDFYYRLLVGRTKRNCRGSNRKIDAGDRQLFEMLLDLTNRVAKLEGAGNVNGGSAAQSEGLGAQPESPIGQARQAVRDQGQAGQRVDESESEPDAEESPETAR